MRLSIMNMLLGQLFNLLTPDMMRRVIDSGLDWLEDKVINTKTKYDDAVVLPIIKLIRTTLDIPDTDESSKVALTGMGDFDKLKLTSKLLDKLFEAIPSDMTKGVVNAGLNVVEDKIKNSVATYDDVFIMPVVKMIRTSCNIPDTNELSGEVRQGVNVLPPKDQLLIDVLSKQLVSK